MKLVLRISMVLSILVLTACASQPRNNYHSQYQQYPVTGILLGGAGGAMIGHALDNEDGVYAGALTGAVIGGVTEYYINKDRQKKHKDSGYREQNYRVRRKYRDQHNYERDHRSYYYRH